MTLNVARNKKYEIVFNEIFRIIKKNGIQSSKQPLSPQAHRSTSHTTVYFGKLSINQAGLVYSGSLRCGAIRW
jgi:hypothetical protein